MDIQLTFEVLAALVAVAMVAGFIDAIAGGGGLLTIPALLLANIPPVAALATNKLQANAGSFAASFAMIKKGLVNPRQVKGAVMMAFVGSALGTVLIQLSPPTLLTAIIPVLLLMIGLYTLFAPRLDDVARPAKISYGKWQNVFVPSVGLYDGYLGPGTGTFFAVGNASLRGMTLTQATAHAKLLNFSTNFASLIFFALGGQVLWQVGTTMMIGQAIGAYFGARVAMAQGARFIKPVIVLMCFAMLGRYLWVHVLSS